MLILHTTILPPDADGRTPFFLWAETDAPGPAPKANRARVRPHPFGAPAAGLLAALESLGDLPAVATERAAHAALTLPSGERAPLPSAALARLRNDEPSAAVRAAAWRIEGLQLAPIEALDLLAAMPLRIESAALAADDDARFWSLIAKFTLELLARQRYLPSLADDGAGAARAVWTPLLDEARDQARFAALLKAMPPAARAGIGTPAARRALVLGALGDMLDAAVRRSGGLSLRAAKNAIAESHWLAALGPGDPVVHAKPAELAALREQLQNWQRPVALAAAADYRVCFRLEAPPAASRRRDARDWLLTFHLQPHDDPSLLVPAAHVWSERGDTVRSMRRRFAGAHERLLSALGHAARLCEPLARALREAAPTACALSTTEAYAFLRESALLLESAGYGVLVPSWWAQRKAGLALRARVSSTCAPDGKSGSGTLSLASLVAFGWELSLGGAALSRAEFERLAALKEPLVEVRGQWVELRPAEIEAALRALDAHREQATLGDVLALALGAGMAPGGLPVADVAADGWVADFLARLRDGDAPAELPQPDGFAGALRHYQLAGMNWLAYLGRWGLGALLADDMGLGKTATTIALLQHARAASGGPALVVCPTSVVGNWQREFAKFAPSLRVLVHHGSTRARAAQFTREAGAHDVVISSYGLLVRDEKALAGVAWSHLVLDEAQNIKNPHARQAQAARRITAPRRIALSGTPVENRLADLWSIMEFLNPGFLGSQAGFRERFARPIERYRDAVATGQLKRLVQPFILRRLKTDRSIIQDLPDKLEMKVFCNLTPEQATLYQAVLKDELRRVAESDGIQRRGAVLAMLLKLKQVCNHPAQFLGDHSALAGRSGKLARLGEMLEEVVAAGDRALVFTQFTEMGDLLQGHLRELFGGEVLFLHGGTAAKARDRMVARFQHESGGPRIFILSLKAGGTGLNLTRASHVFHFDRWWNPAVENQATDRAFRIGQTRTVQAHKFVCIGTMEEKIDALIEGKQALSASVVGAGEGWLTELSTEQLRDVFALRREAIAE